MGGSAGMKIFERPAHAAIKTPPSRSREQGSSPRCAHVRLSHATYGAGLTATSVLSIVPDHGYIGLLGRLQQIQIGQMSNPTNQDGGNGDQSDQLDDALAAVIEEANKLTDHRIDNLGPEASQSLETANSPLQDQQDVLSEETAQKDQEQDFLIPEYVPEAQKMLENQENEVQFPTIIVDHEEAPEVDEPLADEPEDPNTSVIIPLSVQHLLFTTPLKSLPPLKDIETITTPKAFSVAKDTVNVNSSPVATNKAPQNDINIGSELFSVPEEGHNAIAAFLNVDTSALENMSDQLRTALVQKSQDFQDLKEENSFVKINQEQANRIQDKKIALLQKNVGTLKGSNAKLTEENELLASKESQHSETIAELVSENASLKSRVSQFELSSQDKQQELSRLLGQKDKEIFELNEKLTSFTQNNIDHSQQLNQLTRQLNEVSNDKFNLKLELTKVANEATYIKNQRGWYEQELKSVQQKYTDLIKKNDSEYLLTSSKVTSLMSQNKSLENTNASHVQEVTELKTRIEKEVARTATLESEIEMQKIKYTKEISSKNELVELTQIQSSQRSDRITQLESYIAEIKTKLTTQVTSLESELAAKTESVIFLEEKVRRTEEALDAELHKETELPKLTHSAEVIAANNPDGISLSSLYTEFNHLKKQLILERSQKEKLADQLTIFVNELESKKPAIANYREQVKFYENSLKEMIGKVETIRIEKAEGEKLNGRLKNRIAEYENELLSLKKLSQDLGKQLCYYLIHSKIRDNNEDPLSLIEKKAIERILSQTGANKDVLESDTDKLISERLVGFVNILELQQKNQELLTVTRQLGRQLESREDEAKAFESIAIEEAKDAILTLEGELDSVSIKLDAVTKERDHLKQTSGLDLPNGYSGDSKYLTASNKELKQKLNDNEQLLEDIQAQSSKSIKELNEKINAIKGEKGELSLKLSSAKHNAELALTKLQNSERTLNNAKKELAQLSKDVAFWKEQSSKQETFLVNKSNELRDIENQVSSHQITINNLTAENNHYKSLQETFKEDIFSLRSDKAQLNEFVTSLQTLLKEREQSSSDLSNRLNQSIENYQSLQERLSEKEEKILILSSQSELALKSQNSKLEQVYDLSQQLLEAKTKLVEKETTMALLQKRVLELSEPTRLSRASFSATENVSTTEASYSATGSLEYEQLKNDLLHAETQVFEFTNIAKSAENALINATNNFEVQKLESDHKIASLSLEKDTLQKELSELTEKTENIRKLLTEAETKHLSQIQELQEQLQVYSLKAESYDQLQSDYEKRLESVNKDLVAQITLNSDVQLKYQLLLENNDSISRELETVKEANKSLDSNIQKLNVNLEAAKNEIAEKNVAVAEEKAGVSQELESFKIRFQDLQSQYQIVLNQLELTKSSVPSDNSGEDLREVVGYLRREKEFAEGKANSSLEEQQKLEIQLAHVTTELNATKSQIMKLKSHSIALDESTKEHNRLLEQLEQLNVLRESNTTLRNENEANMKRISLLEAELSKASVTISAGVVDESSLDADVKEQNMRLLAEENERLKTQLNSNEEVKTMMQRFENLKTEFRNKLSNLRSKNKELEKQVEELKASLEAVNKELVDTKSSHQLQLESVNESFKQQLENASSGGTLENEAGLRDQLAKAEALKAETENKIQLLTQDKEALTKQVASLSSGLPDEYQKELTILRAQFEEEKTALRQTLLDEYEAKLKQEAQSGTGINPGAEAALKVQLESDWKAKFAAIEKSVDDRKKQLEQESNERFSRELDARVQEEVLKAVSNGNSGTDQDQMRQFLIKKYEAQIENMKKEFEAQLSKEKLDLEKNIEKKFEFKIRVLNRKVEKLEKGQDASRKASASESASSTAPAASLPVNPKTAVSAPPQALPPLSHPFTESTLTVHRPAVERPTVNKQTKLANNANSGANTNNANTGKKRPFVNKNQGGNKRPKE